MSAAPELMRTSATTEPVMEAQWIGEEAGFAELKNAWNALVDAIPSHTVFLRYEWFDAAWQWRKRDAQLAILALRREGNLVGIAPLIRTRRRQRGLPVRYLEFLTVPDTQFCDLIVAPDHRAAVMAALISALRGACPPWDVINLNRLAPNSIALTGLPAQMNAAALPYRCTASELNLYIDLRQTWEQFYAQRSRRLKKANNLVANRLQRAAARLDIERTADQQPDALASAAETAIALSAQSWKRQTGVSLDQPGPLGFFRRLVDHARSIDWLRISLLRLDETAIAMELQLVYDGQIHALRSDFAESFKTLSPGTYLNWKLLQALFDCGLQRYWFGPGENTYKLHWTHVGEPLHSITMYGTTLRGRWLRVFETTLKPWLKKLLRRDS